MATRVRLLACAGLAASLAGCAGSLSRPPVQGLAGTFTTYGLAGPQADCLTLKTQSQRDSCRREGDRMAEEPYRGSLVIRNLDTRRALDQALDAQGAYRAVLEPGNYEVCVNGECSDPIEVRMGEFSTYGQRLPKPPPQEKPATGVAESPSAP